MLLVALPAGSWFYLKSGFQVRKSAFEALKVKAPFPDDIILGNKHFDECINNNVSLVYKNEANAKGLIQNLQEVHTIFKHRDRFSFISLEENKDTLAGLVSEVAEDWKIINLSSSYYNKFPIGNNEIMVLDTLANIRGKYQLEKEDLQRMTKQLTILFPIEKKQKIRLKRDVTEQ